MAATAASSPTVPETMMNGMSSDSPRTMASAPGPLNCGIE
jgi:hypothetical protein